jgi:hypothetical protein
VAILRDSSILSKPRHEWMDQDCMLDWVDCVWDPYTKGSRCDEAAIS